MKNISKISAYITIVAVLLAASVFNVSAADQTTGNDYLKAQNTERVHMVSTLIDGARQGGVTIKQSPVAYCRKLDAFFIKRPDMKARPLALVLKTLIVMEYDWSQKGVNKDELARQYLGDKIYNENKARLGK